MPRVEITITESICHTKEIDISDKYFNRLKGFEENDPKLFDQILSGYMSPETIKEHYYEDSELIEINND